MTNREAARRLGVRLTTLTCNAWKWRETLRAVARCVRLPGGGRINIYPVELIDRLCSEREAAAMGPVIPDGFVDKDGACAFFGVTRLVWKTWIRQKKVRIGHDVAASVGARRKLYATADLERLREELFGQDKLYKRSDNTYHVPAEYVRREEAWEKFGVGISTWQRWEGEGKITCGVRMPGGPKVYKVEDINRLLDEYGRWAPPYPDPERPGVFRVPLSGRDIKRREALIDADVVAMIAGGSCAWSKAGTWGFVSFNGGGIHGMPLRRMVMSVTDGKINVRHVNGEPLDCRRENLVVRTITQRTRNMRKIKSIKGRPPTSRFKGVFWETYTKKWRARISVDDKTIWLGRFTDEVTAGGAYDEAAMKHFGEHARLNFPDGVKTWIDQPVASWETTGPVELTESIKPVKLTESTEPARWRNASLDWAA